ncbi:prolipoprotein diacylglyceryl transferase [Falsiroseomonas bella]|uniref:Phosphatidylglycerol--prolipoprotein diacylglyceryl transferase n=1 Tax=Falsiroseomonas bella TaxID=2184016 RepID=A0A317FCW0_9PROT|nr:prolipoprotein diacylglyceryl transferase [Falsiroseomonas bella]PWS36921.1 prolipoprotein diacylglyceryl transferase [Falsiroseomonas bella]
MLPVIAFPAIDPVALEIGPFQLRWYALAYIGGIVLGWWLARRLCALPPAAATREEVDDAVTWITLGIILGGRLGYVLFYRPGYYITAPWEALYVWHGGMSFHGGMLGVVIALLWFTRRRGLDPFLLADRVVTVVPIGLFLGRLANFANGELWGRVSDVPWAMVFPHGGPEPRHPSQLYQAFLEGICLFTLLMVLVRIPAIRARPGLLSGVFLVGYGVARLVGEIFRQPDAHLGFLFAGITMGQLLSLPMIAAGAWLILRARSRPARSEAVG